MIVSWSRQAEVKEITNYITNMITNKITIMVHTHRKNLLELWE